MLIKIGGCLSVAELKPIFHQVESEWWFDSDVTE
jgi:hypothetical protein